MADSSSSTSSDVRKSGMARNPCSLKDATSSGVSVVLMAVVYHGYRHERSDESRRGGVRPLRAALGRLARAVVDARDVSAPGDGRAPDARTRDRPRMWHGPPRSERACATHT